MLLRSLFPFLFFFSHKTFGLFLFGKRKLSSVFVCVFYQSIQRSRLGHRLLPCYFFPFCFRFFFPRILEYDFDFKHDF